MAGGICVFAAHFEEKLDPVFYELLSAAKQLQNETGEKTVALFAGDTNSNVFNDLKLSGIDEIQAVNTGDMDLTFKDDIISDLMTSLIKKVNPFAVIVPATTIGRSVFSRTALNLDCGMTADCTQLYVANRDDGSKYIEQMKPSFGDNIFVKIVTKEGRRTQMMTVRPGVYPEYDGKANQECSVIEHDDIVIPVSSIEVIDEKPLSTDNASIMGADIVVVAGRGAVKGDNFEIVKKFAEKIGAEIGGTRPVADAGIIPFENQIGQTGFTIRPKICISLGVSGAIQHTEGIHDTKLYIAINEDENAAIFNYADYGVVGDLREILEKCI